MQAIDVLDAPSNLGLRPSAPGVAPGCYKAPWALRELGLLEGLTVREAGVVVPPRYLPDWQPGDATRNTEAIAGYSRRLADRLEPLLGSFTVVIGGDCSVLIGEALALRRRGRYGLAFVDGHGDFRHEGNGVVEAAAGEDLAIVTGRGDARLADLEGIGPLLRDEDVVVIGPRQNDAFRDELKALGTPVHTSDDVRRDGVDVTSRAAMDHLDRPELAGLWVHLDVDVLDASVMPAVDSPEPDGLSLDELEALLTALVSHPRAVGLDLCIYDPDLDPDGRYGRPLARTLNRVLAAAAAR